ncbi:hypothetical protein N0V85_002668 [Neurospora sp. IMI 360204]|nr:hypothetical protein N0V85_002668 [Neurospora sp. IMI 360204]
MHPQEPQSHGPGAPSFSARLQAATTLSGILSRHNIPHAFIGGFAFNLLGTSRSTLDIDLIIEDSAFSPGPSKPPKALEPIHQIRQLLVESDERFCLVGSGLIPKLIFTAQTEEERPVRVPVETLRAGSLGLPRHVNQVMTLRGIPILAPRFLLLTKIKRCTNFLGSDRPKSVARFKSDEGDIKHLLKWLSQEKERVDFKGYHHGGTGAEVDDNESMKTYDNLIHKVGELVQFWHEKGDEEEETVAGLQKVMEEDDWRSVLERKLSI